MPRKRPVTDTHAWCNMGQHMVPHDGFAKNQQTCSECRKVYNRNNYSRGLVCAVCSTPVSNNNGTGKCRSCRAAWLKASNALSRPRRWVSVQGYALVNQRHDHPNANQRGELLEHVLVMSEMLGRPLCKGENVHHKNGVRDDNRPENLELWVTSQPSGQRPEDLVEWAREILARYAA